LVIISSSKRSLIKVYWRGSVKYLFRFIIVLFASAIARKLESIRPGWILTLFLYTSFNGPVNFHPITIALYEFKKLTSFLYLLKLIAFNSYMLFSGIVDAFNWTI
jgi:hypothetical protein